MQVVLVYRQPFRRNLLLKCVSQPKIAKKIIKSYTALNSPLAVMQNFATFEWSLWQQGSLGSTFK